MVTHPRLFVGAPADDGHFEAVFLDVYARSDEADRQYLRINFQP